MAHPYHHALSSVKKWGGQANDYLPIHNWFDESKAFLADFRHRALRHHAEGIFLCERLFGISITNSDGKVIPIRWIGEQHVKEDLGRIPTAADWLTCIRPERWMNASDKLSRELAEAESTTPMSDKQMKELVNALATIPPGPVADANDLESLLA